MIVNNSIVAAVKHGCFICQKCQKLFDCMLVTALWTLAPATKLLQKRSSGRAVNLEMRICHKIVLRQYHMFIFDGWGVTKSCIDDPTTTKQAKKQWSGCDEPDLRAAAGRRKTEQFPLESCLESPAGRWRWRRGQRGRRRRRGRRGQRGRGTPAGLWRFWWRWTSRGLRSGWPGCASNRGTWTWIYRLNSMNFIWQLVHFRGAR